MQPPLRSGASPDDEVGASQPLAIVRRQLGCKFEFELPGDEAIMHRDGDRLVIEPVRKRGLVALLKMMKPLENGFPEIDDPVPAPENVL